MEKQKTLSFAAEAKEEIARLDFNSAQKRSILSAFAKTSGSIRLGSKGEELELSSESAVTAKFLYLAIHEIYGVDPRFAYTRGIGFRKRVKFHVLVPEADYILSDLEVDFFSGKVPHHLTGSPELSAAYLAGAFLSSGSVNDPSSSNYHLEIAVNDKKYATWLSHLMNKVQGHSFDSKIVQRRQQWVVYLKRSDQISDFLILVGATSSCLKFENVRVDRDFANIGNRLANLDSANFSKTMKASERQCEEIRYFVEKIGWDHIDNPKLKALMKLRLDHPDSTLDELAELLSEELAVTISKSNVNHLLRYVHSEYGKANHEK